MDVFSLGVGFVAGVVAIGGTAGLIKLGRLVEAKVESITARTAHTKAVTAALAAPVTSVATLAPAAVAPAPTAAPAAAPAAA